MAIMMEKLYDALRAANVPDDKARAAAVEVAEFKDEPVTFKVDIGRIDARLTMLIWIVGVHFAVTLAGFGLILNQLLSISARLPS